MPDLRCQCGKKIAEYNDYEVKIMDKKCKHVTTLRVVNGKLIIVNDSDNGTCTHENAYYCHNAGMCALLYGKCKFEGKMVLKERY
jgi:hypothetical protein